MAYDAAFRRQAAATGQRDWSKINTSLYTICFTGKARRSQRCDICLSAAHMTAECYALGEEDPDASVRAWSQHYWCSRKEAALPGGQDRQMFAGFTTRGGATPKTANTDMHAGGAAADTLAVIADRRVHKSQAPCAMSTPEAQEERLLPIKSDTEWAGREGVESIMHYLDDFLIVASNCESCEEALRKLLTVFARLKVPIATEKLEGPTRTLAFLGIEMVTPPLHRKSYFPLS